MRISATRQRYRSERELRLGRARDRPTLLPLRPRVLVAVVRAADEVRAGLEPELVAIELEQGAERVARLKRQVARRPARVELQLELRPLGLVDEPRVGVAHLDLDERPERPENGGDAEGLVGFGWIDEAEVHLQRPPGHDLEPAAGRG